jgi:putative hydrolase
VSDAPFASGGGPLGDLMRDLARLLTHQGPLNWEVAGQLATWTATEGQLEPNPDPLSRIRTEELLRVADMHVAEATGLATSRRGWLSARSVTRSQWASTMLRAWKEPLSAVATSLGGAGGGASDAPESTEDKGAGSMTELLGNLPQVVMPLMFGAQVGTMVGQLARRAMGQYDVPMPPPEADELLAVPASVDEFAKEWGLGPDDARMYLCVRDVAFHAVLSRAHVSAFLQGHLLGYAGAFRMETDVIEQRLAGLDPSDAGSFQRALGDPESLLQEMQTEQQRRLLVPLRAFLSVLSGYTDFVIDKVGRRLVGSYPLVAEAFRRRRLEATTGERLLAKLLGVEVDQDVVESGQAFVEGVLERAGETALAQLWSRPEALPTPAEVEAPGLWLARTEFLA